MARLISGKEMAEAVKTAVRADVQWLGERGLSVELAVLVVGENPASAAYVKGKHKDCHECGIVSHVIALPETVGEEELLSRIEELNRQKTVNGILMQLPLPPHIDQNKVLEAISPEKDVDGFTPINAGNMFLGRPCFLPCTPAGVIRMLKESRIQLAGRNCVVVGRSNLVGKPLALLLTAEDATVTLCHSKTKDLAEICKNADVLISAVGKAGFIKADMIKPGAAVIDVGIDRAADGKLHGDVAFEEAEQVAGCISPVPGGVGLMTRAMLMENTLRAAFLQNGFTSKRWR